MLLHVYTHANGHTLAPSTRSTTMGKFWRQHLVDDVETLHAWWWWWEGGGWDVAARVVIVARCAIWRMVVAMVAIVAVVVVVAASPSATTHVASTRSTYGYYYDHGDLCRSSLSQC